MSEEIMYTFQEWARLPIQTIEVYRKFLYEGGGQGQDEFPYIL
jgi:hypothetical protein